jgi:hypothetical protein
MDTLKNQMLPQLQSGAQQVNALGSSRLGLAQGQAMGDASKALANQNATTMLNAYGQGLGAQTSALGQTGNMLSNLLAPGQTVEQYQQRALDDSMKRWEFAQNEPWQRMGNVGSLLDYLKPLGIQTGNMVGMESTPNEGYRSPWQSLLGGASTGYSIWDTFNKNRTQTPSFSTRTGANAPLGSGGYTGGFGY